MNRTPDLSSRHPLISAYLRDLERALSAAEPSERADTLASIDEHIHDRLAELSRLHDPTTGDVRTVLDELGPVERVAAAATPAAAPPSTGRWVPPVALGLAVLCVVLLVVNYFLALVSALGVLVFAVLALRRDTSPARWVLRTAAIIAAGAATLALAAVLFLTAVGTTTETVPEPPVPSAGG